MKKLLMLIIAILSLSSCAKDGGLPPSDFGENAVPATYRWRTDKGTYFTATSHYLSGATLGRDSGPEDFEPFIGDPLLLYINDAVTGNDVILCNRPDCPHDSIDCNAFLPYDEYEEDFRKNDFRKTSVVFADGEYVYAHNGGSRIFRFEPDGTERTEAVILQGKYQAFSGGWLMNGKLYAQAHSFTTTGDFNIGINLTKVLLEIDYRSGEVREIWQDAGEPNSFSGIITVGSGKVYGIKKIYPYRPPSSFATDSEEIDFRNETEYILFSVDPDDETAQTNIIRTGTEYEFNPCLKIDFSGENPAMYYHSRLDESVYRLDSVTGESALIVDNIAGTLQINGMFGGWLFMIDFMKDGEDINRVFEDLVTGSLYEDNEKMRVYKAMYFVDTATGEMAQSAVITRRTPGEDGFTDIIYERDGYFYIEVERQETELDVWGDGNSIYTLLDRHLIGRISPEDYRAGNTDAIERLGWVSADEFCMMVIENQKA